MTDLNLAKEAGSFVQNISMLLYRIVATAVLFVCLDFGAAAKVPALGCNQKQPSTVVNAENEMKGRET